MKENMFQLKSSFTLAGSQGPAVDSLCSNFEKNKNHQVLLGVTGSGKTFSIAHVIQRMNIPALVLAPNKTLAAQLFSEFKELFPKNAVEYFVSYYDYYQPEAYIPVSDTYIEKDSSINDQIDRMRHSATHALMSRKDVIIVSSVSCIYGLGSPSDYEELAVHLFFNQQIDRDELLKKLVAIQFMRNDEDFHRGVFRVRGDTVDVFPPHEDQKAFRIEFFGDYIDRMSCIDPITGETLFECQKVSFYPVSHYVSTQEKHKRALVEIKRELTEHLKVLRSQKKVLEMDRLKKRTLYDLEIIREMGVCPGIENYSRHLSGRKTGEPPPTLLEYFPEKFLMVIDESHITVPQVGGMYAGDRRRKSTLVEYGFRLPSALDNRPLNFGEFENFLDRVVYVSATPGPYELEKSGQTVVEQIIRPTGLLDPEIKIRPVRNQVDDLLAEIQNQTQRGNRCLVTTLTKKMSEDLTSYFQKLGVKARYLHSEIKTIERTSILKDLRLGVFDVLVGINLLREGLDLPEVGLVAIMDADKEGFLRSTRSLIQTMGRAARNVEGQVILYANHVTMSMQEAIDETNRRREIQEKFNQENNITPRTVQKSVPKELMEIYGFDKENLKKGGEVKTNFPKRIADLKKQMKEASDRLDFEEAVRLRDQIKRYELLDLTSK
ncbi:MAG: excinuclease ABC subunit UvrB [Bdellovibrionales bacterium]|nr:excinuclease ABC subunit UvrB [Bdellovibrionales bacterium]